MADRVIRGGQPQDVALHEFDVTVDRILGKRRELLARSPP